MSLRVITGLRRGHKIKGPVNNNTRPTEDRIKEALFNILFPFEDEFTALDLFAATGNIGIEFLSRGATKVYFSEKDRQNISDLKDNLEHTKFTEQAVILEGDFKRNILQIREKIDYVFIDPPYKSDYYKESLELMLDRENFKDSLFITEMNIDHDFSAEFEEIDLVYEKKYGKKWLRFYRRKDESSISG